MTLLSEQIPEWLFKPMRDWYGFPAAEILTSLSSAFWHFIISWPFTSEVISHLFFVFKVLDFHVLSPCSSGDQNQANVPPLCLLSIDYFHCPRTDEHNFLTRWKSNKVKEEGRKNCFSGTVLVVKSNFKWIRADQREKNSITKWMSNCKSYKILEIYHSFITLIKAFVFLTVEF